MITPYNIFLLLFFNAFFIKFCNHILKMCDCKIFNIEKQLFDDNSYWLISKTSIENLILLEDLNCNEKNMVYNKILCENDSDFKFVCKIEINSLCNIVKKYKKKLHFNLFFDLNSSKLKINDDFDSEVSFILLNEEAICLFNHNFDTYDWNMKIGFEDFLSIQNLKESCCDLTKFGLEINGYISIAKTLKKLKKNLINPNFLSLYYKNGIFFLKNELQFKTIYIFTVF